MNREKKPKFQHLAVLAFATSALGGIHMLTLVLLSAFVYHDTIRGYAPAGITGLLVLAVCSLFMLIYLATVARRHQNSSFSYILLGFLSIPLAILISSAYASALQRLLGHTFKVDIIISSIGAALLFLTSIMLYIIHIRNRAQPIAATNSN